MAWWQGILIGLACALPMLLLIVGALFGPWIDDWFES